MSEFFVRNGQQATTIDAHAAIGIAVMHNDLEPFAPLSLHNPLLGWVSIQALHKICLYSGALGLVIYLVTVRWWGRR